MPIGPKRKQAPLSKRVSRRVVIHPDSRASGQSGIVTDKRPMTTASNLQRDVWGITNRADKGDWT